MPRVTSRAGGNAFIGRPPPRNQSADIPLAMSSRPAAAIALMTIGVNLIVDWILSINARPSSASAEM